MSKFVQEVVNKARWFGKCVPRGALIGLNTIEHSFTRKGTLGDAQVLFAVATLPSIGDELYKQAFMQGIPVDEWLLVPPTCGDMMHQRQWYARLLRDNVEDEETLDKLFVLFYNITDFTTEVARVS